MTNPIERDQEVTIVVTPQGGQPIKRQITVAGCSPYEFSVHTLPSMSGRFFRTEVWADGPIGASLVMRQQSNFDAQPFMPVPTVIR